MDKEWMDLPRQTSGYRQGVEEFIKFAFANSAKRNKILCRCKCANCSWKEGSIVSEHLICEGFSKDYKRLWRYHGEASSSTTMHNAQFGCHIEERQAEPVDMFFSRNIGRDLVGKCPVTLDHQSWLQAHRSVLMNYDQIEPFLIKHLEYLSSTGRHRNIREINHVHLETFHEWFRLHVAEMLLSVEQVTEEVKILARGPLMVAKKYSSYTINGNNFHTKFYDEGRSGQCSGVALQAQTSIGTKTNYGIITEILELDYRHKGKIALFKFDWVDNHVHDKWQKVDKFGITLVNFKHLFNTGEKSLDEPFTLASQATQVYYVQDPLDKDWHAAVQSKPRDCYDMAEVENEIVQPCTGLSMDANFNVTGDGTCVRKDIDGSIVGKNAKGKRKNFKRKRR